MLKLKLLANSIPLAEKYSAMTTFDFSSPHERQAWEALERLLRVARKDTGQARRVADFLLAWHNAEENGGWDPVDLWNVDDAIAEDMRTVPR
jgi:hypothetical protein